MEIWWSGTHRVEVYLPSDYAHEMCGVCGDFNFDPSNDLILGPKCVGDGEPGSLVRVCLYWRENDIISRWVHRESKVKEKKSLSLSASVNEF